MEHKGINNMTDDPNNEGEKITISAGWITVSGDGALGVFAVLLVVAMVLYAIPVSELPQIIGLSD